MRTTLTTLTILLALVVAGCGDDGKVREMDAALRATVQQAKRPAFVTADTEGTRLWKQTRQFYEKRGFTPAWIDGTKPRPEIQALTEALREAANEGLNPELYNVTVLEQRLAEASKGFLTKKGFDPKEAGLLDVWLTYLYMKVASDLADGLSDLASADPSWQIAPEKFVALAHLEGALAQGRI